MNNELHFSSKTPEWATPQKFFDKLNDEFHFTLDPCSTHENAKCVKHYTKEDDGLNKDWSDSVVFMNPPYGKPEWPCKNNCKKKICKKRGFHNLVYIPGIGDWIKKAYDSSKSGATCVCLIPSRTDTDWFWDYCMKGEIRFVRGRLVFGGQKDAAPFPSAVVIFRP